MDKFEKNLLKYIPCYNCVWGKKCGRSKILCSVISCREGDKYAKDKVCLRENEQVLGESK